MANTDIINKIAHLLWERQVDEALDLLLSRRESTLQRIASLQNELEGEKAFLSQLEALLPPGSVIQSPHAKRPMPPTNVQVAVVYGDKHRHWSDDKDDPADRVSAAQKEERRRNVIRTAKRMAPKLRDSVSVSQVAHSLRAQGVEMWVPQNRMATTIGNILSRTEFFDLASPGNYMRIAVLPNDPDDRPQHQK